MDINGEEASLDSEDDEDEDDLEEDEEIKDFMVEDNPEDLENEENMVLLGQKRQRDFEIEEDTLQKRMR